MPVTNESSAPYAPAHAMKLIINRYRDRGMQTPITTEVLERAGISESLISRTLQALYVLDLIDENGEPTQIFEGIRLAPEPEYKNQIEAWIKTAYAEVFKYVDPSKDSETHVRDAFRTYRPHGQQSRMVSLFLGLCKEAGLIEETTRESKPPRTKSTVKSPRSGARRSRRKKTSTQISSGDSLLELPPAIVGLLRSLPKNGEGWDQDRFNQFVETFSTVLGFCYPISSSPSEDPGHLSTQEQGDES